LSPEEVKGPAARIRPPVILAFGGFDPTGGAGVLMDAKAVHAAGGYAAAVPSCLAVQSTASFSRVVPLPRSAIDRSLACAVKSFRIRAVKIGMVGTRAAAEAILAFAGENPRLPVVLDPVLRASSGGALLSRDALPAYRKLLCRAGVLTPNLTEIEKILDRKIGSFGEAILAARDLSSAAGAAVILKGGHFPWKGKRGVDIVFEEGRVTLLGPSGKARRVDAHGTGCALASAIAARLACGDPVVEAARSAKSILERMVASGFSSAEGRWTLFG
jgi:hydroxymethylpyrimidine kinase/phosphomethylpyrimidine kinase/thiamine-phosphate diphosphorylase